jgi:predicted nucleic acid-binding protein
MTAVFADTSYWIALTNVQDADHGKAEAFSASLKPRPVLTTEAVLIEYLNYFAGWGPRFRRAAAAAVQAMMAAGALHIVAHSEQTFQAGLALYNARPDKGYSLTDCISMQIMRREGLTEALTSDRHFEQEGFCVLFRDA